LSWWDDPSRQRIQGLFREAIAEIGAAPPPDVPAGYSIFRFSDTDELRRLLDGAGLTEIAVRDHRTTYLVADIDALWRGGLGSFAITSSAIASQNTGGDSRGVGTKSCRLSNRRGIDAPYRLQDWYRTKTGLTGNLGGSSSLKRRSSLLRHSGLYDRIFPQTFLKTGIGCRPYLLKLPVPGDYHDIVSNKASDLALRFRRRIDSGRLGMG
jgi:hypothetical protein